MTSPLTTGSIATPQSMWRSCLNGAYVLLGATAAGWAVGWLGVHLAHDSHPTWLLARVSGLVALTLLTVLVSLGLALAHPRGTALRSLQRSSLIKVHVGLASFTATFTVLHVVILAIDSNAGVGWAGLLLPLGAEYRPVPVTLGWIALYGGIAAGLSARFAGYVGRVWWPVHRVAVLTYAAAWLHGVLAGTDSAGLTLVYAASLLAVLSIAGSRYLVVPIRTAAGDR